MNRHRRVALLLALAAMLSPAPAYAGMAIPKTLTEMARLRLENLSFFLLVLLASAFLIKLLWNSLRRTFQRLPRLTYLKSLGLVLLWGLLFVIVLLMIAGARELMTPGAWEHSGAVYRLKQPGK